MDNTVLVSLDCEGPKLSIASGSALLYLLYQLVMSVRQSVLRFRHHMLTVTVDVRTTKTNDSTMVTST